MLDSLCALSGLEAYAIMLPPCIKTQPMLTLDASDNITVLTLESTQNRRCSKPTFHFCEGILTLIGPLTLNIFKLT